MLSELPLRQSYRSSRQELLKGFYIPCMREATNYSRAVGYFTSHILSAAAEGLGVFIERGGRMRLVASPMLSQEDADAIATGYAERTVVEASIAASLLRELEASMPDVQRERLGFLAWMVAEGQLDIKIALVSRGSEVGIYHEKAGIFADDLGVRVAFSGSANESVGGMVSNFESIDVYRSWVPEDLLRLEEKEGDFEDLWNDLTPGLAVYEFPEAARERLLKYRPATQPRYVDEPEAPSDLMTQPMSIGRPVIPRGITVRDYQWKAIHAWLTQGGRGTWRMATGTGKTIAALTLFQRLMDAAGDDEAWLVVIVCPFRHLVDQWHREARNFGISAVRCYESRTRWLEDFGDALAASRTGSVPFAAAITTNSTFVSSHFVELLAGWKAGNFLLIGDEVHNLGSEAFRSCLPPNATHRLGLSATPERWFDAAGTEAIVEYFGPVCFSLGLEEAIEIGALCPYDYFPRIVRLTDDEMEEYVAISRKIGGMIASGGDEPSADESDGVLQALLMKRARLIGSAVNKLTGLAQALRPLKDSTHNLIYCGDGRVEFPLGDSEIRQVEAVQHLVGTELGMRANTYLGETSLDERDDRRRRFASGDLQALIAIRCLDEGVDIPATRRAFFLASSANPKQWIQRRGRVLRQDPSSGKTSADIFDMIAVPPTAGLPSDVFDLERRLVGRELARALHFASLARNGIDARGSLFRVMDEYNLLDLVPAEERA